MQRLVGVGVGVRAEARSREVVEPVRPGVVRQRGPGERRAQGEARAGGGGLPAAGAPQQRGEEQQGRLQRRADAGQQPAGPLAAHGEEAEEHQQDREDAGLPEVQGAAHGQRQDEQADRHGGGEERGAAGDRPRQGAGGHQAEHDDEAEGAEGPGQAEGLLPGAGEGLEDEAGEGGAGEPVRVVEGALGVQDAARAEPGLQVGEALALGGAQDGGRLPGGQDGGEQPEGDAGRSDPRPGSVAVPRFQGFGRSPVLTVRHAASRLPTRSPCLRPDREGLGCDPESRASLLRDARGRPSTWQPLRSLSAFVRCAQRGGTPLGHLRTSVHRAASRPSTCGSRRGPRHRSQGQPVRATEGKAV